jgi:glycosyltransferase involved in cell wall biosynthesis
LLNYLNIFPENVYKIDLQLFDDLQDEARMYDMIPENVNVLPPLKQLTKWTPALMEELRNTGREEMAEVKTFIRNRNCDENFKKQPLGVRHIENWEHLKMICPSYEGYDIAIAFMTTLPLKIVAEKVKAPRKYVFIHMDLNAAIETGSMDESLVRSEQAFYDLVDGIICVTHQNAASFCKLFPSLHSKVTVLTNVSSRKTICEQAAAFYPSEYKSSKFNLLTVGRICEQKGIDILLKTAHIIKERGMNFNWFVLGHEQQNKYTEKCYALRESLNLQDEVIFLGSKANPFPYYKNCDLYVQTSLFEGRPLSIEEAMVLCCPIVTTEFSSVHDQIKDGINGRICPTDPTSLASVIYDLYCNPNERKRLAEGNKDYSGDSGMDKYHV